MSTVINLPAPNKTGSMSLEEAIVNRRSQRDFLSKPLTIEQIGQIAWSAQGTEPNSGFRTVPSAGATYFIICPRNIHLKNWLVTTSVLTLPRPDWDKDLSKLHR
ncbi:MAG: hypothetical protein ACYSRR_08415 [Planctomycetota bacterium]